MNIFELQQKEFQQRHIGPDTQETRQMLRTIGVSSLEELTASTVPPAIRMKDELNLPEAMNEDE